MDLELRGHDSILIDKNQAFGVNMVKFTRVRGVLQEVTVFATGCYRFATRRYNSPNEKVNNIQMGWDNFLFIY